MISAGNNLTAILLSGSSCLSLCSLRPNCLFPGSTDKLLRSRLAQHNQVSHVTQRDVMEAVLFNNKDHRPGLIEGKRIVLFDRHDSAVVQMQLEGHERPLVQGAFDVARLDHVPDTLPPLGTLSRRLNLNSRHVHAGNKARIAVRLRDRLPARAVDCKPLASSRTIHSASALASP